MPKRARGLTARTVATVTKPGLYADGNGLYLQVTASGAKSWVFRFQIEGRRRDMGLGSASVFSLADARTKAEGARRLVSQGIDPLEHRKALETERKVQEAKALTFRQCATAYMDAMEAGWRNDKHRQQWRSTLETYAFPVIGDLPVSSIDTGLVVRILEPIWTGKTETASRVRGRIEAILDYAKVRHYREGENPARWKGHLEHVLAAKGDVAAVTHHASMPYADVPAFWPRLQVQDGMGARALELVILTATRTTEVLAARWPEIDLDGRLWTIPAERMKAKKEHRVPLTDPAISLLRKLWTVRATDDGYVFQGQREKRPLSNMSMAMCLRRMKLDVTPHGFRSTFRTWAAEQTTAPDAVAEACLAHTISDSVIAAYLRTEFFDKRRGLMEAWARYVQGQQTEGKPALAAVEQV